MAASPQAENVPAHTNALAGETSPYLLQHAHNPVNWRPWGEGAFAEARERGVPILVSIGYSTCYWCHVMERQCFEDEAIARLMNEKFVCIKVDREERPDVDEIYMAAVQILTRAGGWPLNAFVTPPGAAGADDPGLKPFYAGTYFPPRPMHGRASWPQVLEGVSSAWATDREKVLEQADRLTEAIGLQLSSRGEPVRVDERHVSEAVGTLLQIHDRERGGFGGAPKFPQPVYLEFLLEVRPTIADPAVRESVDRAIRLTLDRMALGGMYDQVGGGFHRYSVDAEWVVPHFEKMLYDNAQLAGVYARAAAAFGDAFYARVANQTVEYVRREMTGERGAFYSAQDAEVDGREGLNYLWTREELDAALGAEEGAFAADVFGAAEGTNFTDPHHPEDGPKNVLVLRARPEALAAELGTGVEELLARIDRSRAALLEVRDTREAPGLDDKILTAWNGMMIAGLAVHARASGDARSLDMAETAARRVLGLMLAQDGTLYRTARGDSGPATPGFLEDYAMLIDGLLALHRASAASGRAELTWLNAARELEAAAWDRFAAPDGGLFDTLEGQSDLIVRSRSSYDGAVPAAQSVMLHNLLELADVTGESGYADRAVGLLRSLSPEIAGSPVGAVNSTRGLLRFLREHRERLDEVAPRGAGEEAELAEGADPVRVLAPGERVTLPADGSWVELPIRIEIEEGYHINAHEPGLDMLTGLEVRVEGSGAVELEAAYPAGDEYRGPAVPEAEDPVLVHTGAVEFVVRLRRAAGAAWSGRPMLVATYQVCTETACLRPTTVELDVAIDAGE